MTKTSNNYVLMIIGTFENGGVYKWVKMGLGLSIALVVIGIAVVCLMIFLVKTTYFGYMNSNTNAEKVVSEKMD